MTDNLPSPHQVKPFMTVIPGRRPKVKLHSSIGHAKNALLQYGSVYNRVRGGDLYEWRDDEWVQLYSVPPNTPESKIPWKRTNR